MDKIDEDIAGPLFGRRFSHARQIFWLAALRPSRGAGGPAIQRLGRIARLEFVVALLQARIDKIAGDVCDGRISLVLGEDDRYFELS